MEEDIKVLEERVKKSRQLFEEVGSHMFLNEEIITIIENLLNAYKKIDKDYEELEQAYEKLKEENEQLKVNEEILMKTKGCLNEDNSTNCRVLESLNYGIRAYEKTLKNSIPISVIQNKKRELEKKKEYLRDEYDEGVVEILCRYSCAIKTLDELLEERNK
jgi:hypothetical protein